MRQLAPSNPSLAVETARLKAARAAYVQRDRQISKNMASKLFPSSKSAPETMTPALPAAPGVLGVSDPIPVSAPHPDPVRPVEETERTTEEDAPPDVTQTRDGGAEVGVHHKEEKTPGLLPMILCSLAVLVASIGIALWLR